MNERISEIWDQAAKASALLRLGENSWETQKAFIEKFAELIVRECADVAFLEANSRKTQRAVLQHFGIKE